MKNQYFGDINDYRKYGLIRRILKTYDFKLLVAWMLTPDDGTPDGKFIDYLHKPLKWEKYDNELFHGIKNLIYQSNNRKVSLIEQTDLLPSTRYFSNIVPDSHDSRRLWEQELITQTIDSNLVFLDPDNGFEVKSKPYGTKNSSKYLYWGEVNHLWGLGNSMLIYQHFCREKRHNFIHRLISEIKERLNNSIVGAFTTPHVVFFLVLQPAYEKIFDSLVINVQSKWEDQIKYWEYTPA